MIEKIIPIFIAAFAVQQLAEIFDRPITALGRHTPFQKRSWILLLSSLAGWGLAHAASLTIITSTNPEWITWVISGLVIGSGTEGVNSILKTLGYAKDQKKAEATDANLADQPAAAAAAAASTIALPAPQVVP